MAVSTYKSWRETFFLAYAATAVLLLGTNGTVGLQETRWLVWTFYSLYFLLFLGGHLYDSLIRRLPFSDNRIAFTFTHTFLYATAGSLVLQLHNGFFMLGIAAFYAMMWRISATQSSPNQRLVATFAMLSLIFFVAFVPLQFDANLTAIAWFTQAMGLAIMARRFDSALLLKSEVLVWLLGTLGLLYFYGDQAMVPASPKASLLDAIALTSIFALGATSFLAYWAKKHDTNDQLLSVYSSFVAWGAALFIIREVGVLPADKLAVIGSYKFYLAASLCVIWSALVFCFGIRQKISVIEVNGWLIFSLSLSAILTDAASSAQKALPLFNARELAFLVGFIGLVVAYLQTLYRNPDRQATDDARTVISISAFLWLMTSATIEIANFFSLYSVGTSPRMFVLCTLWALFALSGFFAAKRMAEDHLRMLSLTVLCGATGALLWYALESGSSYSPILNPRFVAFMVLWLCIYFPLRELNQQPLEDGTDVWQPWKITMSTALMVLPLWLITQETLSATRVLHTPDSATIFVLCMVWAIFGCAGFWTAQRLGENHLKVLTIFTLMTAGLMMLSHSLISTTIWTTIWTPILNIRLATFVTLGLCIWLTRKMLHDGENVAENEGWQWCEKALGSALLLLPLWATTQEIWNGTEYYKADIGLYYSRYASLLISLFWSIYGALTLYTGVLRQQQNLRIAGLSLGALTVCKVYLLDLSFLDGGLRVLSLGGLGISLLFISWLYGRLARQEINTNFPKTP